MWFHLFAVHKQEALIDGERSQWLLSSEGTNGGTWDCVRVVLRGCKQAGGLPGRCLRAALTY